MSQYFWRCINAPQILFLQLGLRKDYPTYVIIPNFMSKCTVHRLHYNSSLRGSVKRLFKINSAYRYCIPEEKPLAGRIMPLSSSH